MTEKIMTKVLPEDAIVVSKFVDVVDGEEVIGIFLVTIMSPLMTALFSLLLATIRNGELRIL